MARKQQPGGKAAKALTKDQVLFIVDEFEKVKDLRMCIIVALEFQGPLRISDILKLQKKDIYMLDGQVRENIDQFDQKTGKRHGVFIYDRNERDRCRLYHHLDEYRKSLNGLQMDSVIFFGNRGTPITVRGVNYKLSQFVGKRNIEQCSTHSSRKAVATDLMLNDGVSIEFVRDLMKHSDVRTTRRYLNIGTSESITVQKKAVL